MARHVIDCQRSRAKRRKVSEDRAYPICDAHVYIKKTIAIRHPWYSQSLQKCYKQGNLVVANLLFWPTGSSQPAVLANLLFWPTCCPGQPVVLVNLLFWPTCCSGQPGDTHTYIEEIWGCC